MAYSWDRSAARYRDEKGRFVPRSVVMGYANQSLDVGADAVRRLGEMVASNQLSPGDWLERMRQEIKAEYIRQYVVAIGGRGRMTPSDWGRVGAMVKEQYKYLGNFAAEIAAGTLTEGQIAQRSAMYINSAREALEKARSLVARVWGADEEVWRLGPVATEHCQDCLDNEAMGWQPIGTFPIPGSGRTKCLTSCRCSRDYRKKPAEGEAEGEIWGG